jgi:hypothetical protein
MKAEDPEDWKKSRVKSRVMNSMPKKIMRRINE